MSAEADAVRYGPDDWPDETWSVERYLEWDYAVHVEAVLRPATVRTYGQYMRNWWIPRIGSVVLGELTMVQIQTALDDVAAKRDLRASTLRSGLGNLSSALERARLNRIIDRNPAAKIRGPHLQPARPRGLTPDELGRWLDCALLPCGLGGFIWAGPMLATAPLTGLRMGELRGLRWENVDIWPEPEGDTAGMIRVVEQIDAFTRRTAWCAPKSVAGHRMVPITRHLAQVLEAHQARIEKHALRIGTRKWKNHDLVFPSIYGNAISLTAMSDGRKKIAELADIEPVPDFNCLRHTYASLLVDSGMPSATVAKLMGHADVGLTIRFYYDPTPKAYDGAAGAIQAVAERHHRQTRYMHPQRQSR